MLNRCLKNNADGIKKCTSSEKLRKLFIYIINKAFKILITIDDLHEDCFLDLEKDIELLKAHLLKNERLMQLCVYNGFDINWLSQKGFPENIKIIYKEVRAQGFLK